MSQRRPKYPFPDAVLTVGQSTVNAQAKTRRSADSPEWEEWQSAFYKLFRGAGNALYSPSAERLSAYGWTPKDLLSACLEPGWMAEQMQSRVGHALSPDGAEAWAALLREVTSYHNIVVETAHYKRSQLMEVLSRNGWSHGEIGDHLGLTKQRVQKLLKEFARTGDAL